MMNALYKPIAVLGLTGMFVMGFTLGCEEEYDPLPPSDNPAADPEIDPAAPGEQRNTQPGSTPGQDTYEIPSSTPEN